MKNNRRERDIAYYLPIRENLKSILKEKQKNRELSIEEYLKIQGFLVKTRFASKVRYRNRCSINGKPRGFRRSVGLSRGAFRYYASFGMIAGIRKG